MRLLIAGAGGHGRVVADLVDEFGHYDEIAFVDDRYPSLTRSGAWPVIGTLGDIAGLSSRFAEFVPAIGSAELRLSLVERAHKLAMVVPVLVHARAHVSSRASLGAGCIVAAGGVVNVGAELGVACIVNTQASVDHDCRLGDGVHVAPGAHVAGDVTIGARTWIGIGASVREGIRVGSDVVIGAGAVCIRDVPSGLTVFGVPARERQ